MFEGSIEIYIISGSLIFSKFIISLHKSQYLKDSKIEINKKLLMLLTQIHFPFSVLQIKMFKI